MKMKILTAFLVWSIINPLECSDESFLQFSFDSPEEFIYHRLNEELIPPKKFSFSSSEGEDLYGYKFYSDGSFGQMKEGSSVKGQNNKNIANGEDFRPSYFQARR
jgi:hypothetical protein